MNSMRSAAKSVDEYIARFPPDVRKLLEKVRMTIRKSAPHAEERISYQIPCFAQEGNLVYFAAFTKHISFFPTASAIRKFKKELSVYEGGKGSVRFPLDEPIPYGLIRKIVKFRLKENLEKLQIRQKK